MKLLFDLVTRACIGTVDGPWHGTAIAIEVDEVPADLSALTLSDDNQIIVDEAAALARAKATRIAEIKRQAQANITALAWRIERAREREQLGVPGETLDHVLREREAIRRASNRCEAAIEAAQDIAAVNSVLFAITDADWPPRNALTRVEFLSRFTDAEQAAILAAYDTNAALRAWVERWRAAETIVVTDPHTIAGVQALEAAGLIAEGRAAAILTPITEAAP